jgi:hypothetical protein
MRERRERRNVFVRIYRFYYEGFRTMTWGRQVWLVILIKLFVMFLILKLFFFKDFLGERFQSEEEKSDYVLEQLSK